MKNIFSKEISPRKWCFFTITVSAVIIFGAALLVYIVDPHYRYRRPFLYKMAYYELYATAPHILKNESYDCLMLGSSMTRNFFINDIDSTFGCKSVKLSASGATTADLRKFFDIASESKGDSLRCVILSLDIYSLNKTDNHYSEFQYLYRDDLKEEYRYLFSRQTFSSMLYLIKCKTRPRRERKYINDRNRMFATDYEGKPYGWNAVMEDVFLNERIHNTQTPYNPEAHKESLYEMLLPMFDNHPQIKFIVYLPPYHIYTYCQSELFHEAEDLIRQRSIVMGELVKRKNVTLYDFQADPKYVENFDFYSDIEHFNNTAAKEILKDLKSGNRKISSSEDIRKNEQKLRALIKKNMPVYHSHKEQFKRR